MKIGCFGKLPISPEFIRVNAAGPTIRAFDQWLQEGMHAARERCATAWQQVFSQMPTWNVVFTPPDTDEALFGALVPSRDRAGRLFPFVVYAITEVPADTHPVYLIPAAHQRFFAYARSTAGDRWREKTAPGVREMLLAADMPDAEDVGDVYRAYLGGRNAQQMFGEAIHTASVGEGADLREQVARYLSSCAQSLGAGRGQYLKIPLDTQGESVELDVAFWLDVVSTTWSDLDVGSLVCWTENSGDAVGHVLIATFPLSPKIFAELLCPTSGSRPTAVEWQARGEDIDADDTVEMCLGEEREDALSLAALRNSLITAIF